MNSFILKPLYTGLFASVQLDFNDRQNHRTNLRGAKKGDVD